MMETISFKELRMNLYGRYDKYSDTGATDNTLEMFDLIFWMADMLCQPYYKFIPFSLFDEACFEQQRSCI